MEVNGNLNLKKYKNNKGKINMTLDTLNPKIQEMVNSQVLYIRRMAMLPDETLRMLLTQQLLEHPHIVDNYEQEEQKKMLHDITKAAQNIKSNPIKISRKVA